MLGTIVDTDALVEGAVAALVACLGLAVGFSVAVYGAARFVDARREGSEVATRLAAALSVTALAICGALIASGIVIMVSDRT